MNIYSNSQSNRMVKQAQSKRGFTLVETLVAIAILMIAVAGPLVVASRGLTAATAAKDQMIATFLAQESMEVIHNRRDMGAIGTSNWLTVDNWSSPPKNLLGCTETNPCDASLLNENSYIIDCSNYQSPVDGKKSCRLFSDQFAGYISDNSGDSELYHSVLGVTFYPSPFYRRFYVEPIVPSNPAEVRVHVLVNWDEGSLPYEIHLTSELVNVNR